MTTRLLSLCLAVLLSSLSLANETIVVVSKDRELGKELLENWSNLSPELKDKFVFSKMDSGRAAFEKTLIVGEQPGWYELAMQTASRMAGKKPQKLSELNPAEQAAVKRLLLGGPVNRNRMEEMLQNPEFKVSFNLAAKCEYLNGGRTIQDTFKLIPDNFAQDLVTPGLEFPANREESARATAEFEKRRIAEMAETPEFVFCKGLTESPQEATVLKRSAFAILEKLQKAEEEKFDKLRAEYIARTLAELQEAGGNWDGKSDIDAKNLPPDLLADFEANFAARAHSYGFESGDQAVAFFRNSMLKKPSFSLMVSYAGNVPGRGVHVTSFTVSIANP